MSKQLLKDKYEKSFYKNLLKIGFKGAEIKMPDKDPKFDQSRKQPDYLIEKANIVFEVKHLDMNAKDVEEEERISSEIKINKSTSYFRPERNTSFTKAVKDSERKFRNHPAKSSVLVYDISNFTIREPDLQMMLEGILEIKINNESGSPKVAGRSFKNRSLRVDSHREIGAVLFIRKVRHYLFHNIMAKNNRLLPLWMWQDKIGSFYCDQFVFVNIPNGEMLSQKLWP